MWGIARLDRSARHRGHQSERGQTLIEFAIVIPVFLLFFTGLVEFALAFNADLDTNYASRAGGLVAAEAGNQSSADCLILSAIEQTYGAPADARDITSVDIQRTNPSGTNVYATSSYTRSGSTTCTRADGSTLTVPYSASSSGYPPAQRCNILGPSGCPTMSPARATVDTVAVQITYAYPWHTPLRSVVTALGGPGATAGLTFTERNVFRMEPVL